MDEERELVKRAQAGDEAAFGMLVQAYHTRVYNVAYGMLQNADDAHEVAQQAWIKAWKKIKSFKGQSRFYTWIYRITTFTGMDLIRKRKRQKEVELKETSNQHRHIDMPIAPSVRSRPDKSMEMDEVQTTFQQALNGLTPDHRTALILREVEGLSYDEIATVMKSKRGTVMSRIFYARKKIQEALEGLR